jgi:hypothetical protein
MKYTSSETYVLFPKCITFVQYFFTAFKSGQVGAITTSYVAHGAVTHTSELAWQRARARCGSQRRHIFLAEVGTSACHNCALPYNGGGQPIGDYCGSPVVAAVTVNVMVTVVMMDAVIVSSQLLLGR